MPRVLVVDDSHLQRRSLTKLFRENGYEIHEAEDGFQGLAKIEEVQPDCVISDLLMPECDGFQMLELIQERKISVPVIVLSADIQTSSQNRCRELGIYHFMNKPANKTELLNIVSHICTHSGAETDGPQ